MASDYPLGIFNFFSSISSGKSVYFLFPFSFNTSTVGKLLDHLLVSHVEEELLTLPNPYFIFMPVIHDLTLIQVSDDVTNCVQ